MHHLVLVRHGQSEWNLQNRFTGWTDVDLTEEGKWEALRAARAVEKSGIEIDCAYTSYLKRAIRTLWIMQDYLERMWIPVTTHWRLNERHYGALQGLNKEETSKRFGREQVFQWRRSFDVPPPALSPEDDRHPSFDRRYAALDPSLLPAAESLQMTIDRVLPLWHERIGPALEQGSTVMVCAHGNSLRGLIKYLDRVSDKDISGLEVPTGLPLAYELDDGLRPVHSGYLPP